MDIYYSSSSDREHEESTPSHSNRTIINSSWKHHSLYEVKHEDFEMYSLAALCKGFQYITKHLQHAEFHMKKRIYFQRLHDAYASILYYKFRTNEYYLPTFSINCLERIEGYGSKVQRLANGSDPAPLNQLWFLDKTITNSTSCLFDSPCKWIVSTQIPFLFHT